jgi:hypothetical protein
MGRVVPMNGRKRKQAIPAEGSKEEEKLVAGLYKRLMAVTEGYHDVAVCKAVAVFMGTLMTHTKEPGMVIGGFMKHIQAVANLAIMQHKPLENVNGTKDNEAQGGQPGTGDAGAPEGSDRNLQGEGQDVLLPAAVEQREGGGGEPEGLRAPGVPDGDAGRDG